MRRNLVLGLCATLAVGACIHDDPVDPSTTTSTTGGSEGAPTTTAGECSDPSECSGPLAVCQQYTCIQGACGVADLPQGSEWPSAFGDCRIDLCDGKGGLMTVLGDDPPPQVIGDCQRYVCDNGDAVTITDESDVDNDGAMV